MRVKTVEQDWGDRLALGGPGVFQCMRCGKVIKGAPRYWVHCINGGLDVLHPDDEALYTPDAGDCGSYPVGPECARIIGREFCTKGGAA